MDKTGKEMNWVEIQSQMNICRNNTKIAVLNHKAFTLCMMTGVNAWRTRASFFQSKVIGQFFQLQSQAKNTGIPKWSTFAI